MEDVFTPLVPSPFWWRSERLLIFECFQSWQKKKRTDSVGCAPLLFTLVFQRSPLAREYTSPLLVRPSLSKAPGLEALKLFTHLLKLVKVALLLFPRGPSQASETTAAFILAFAGLQTFTWYISSLNSLCVLHYNKIKDERLVWAVAKLVVRLWHRICVLCAAWRNLSCYSWVIHDTPKFTPALCICIYFCMYLASDKCTSPYRA